MESPTLSPARASFHHSHSTTTKLFDEVRAIVDAGWEAGELDEALIRELDEFSARLGAYVLLHIEQEEWTVFPQLRPGGSAARRDGVGGRAAPNASIRQDGLHLRGAHRPQRL